MAFTGIYHDQSMIMTMASITGVFASVALTSVYMERIEDIRSFAAAAEFVLVVVVAFSASVEAHIADVGLVTELTLRKHGCIFTLMELSP